MFEVDFLGPSIKAICGVVDFLSDTPLGMDYLCKTHVLLDFKTTQVVHSKANLAVPFSLRNPEIAYDFSDVSPPGKECFHLNLFSAMSPRLLDHT